MNRIIEEDIKTILSNPIIDWNRFKHKTVLITGASGMLPVYMVYTLLYLNILKNFDVKVIGLVRNIERARAVLQDLIYDPHLEIMVQDVSQPIQIDQNVDFIVHAASQASPKYYGVDPVGTLKANVMGTGNVLELARQKKSEAVLFFSSVEVYGYHVQDDESLKENSYGLVDPLLQRSCYAESKRMGENMCVSWNAQYAVNAKIVRLFPIYAPTMKLNGGRAFADFCRNIINGEDIILRSDGSAKRTFCYVTDATVAFFKVLLDGENTAYNVGNPNQNMTLKSFAKMLAGLYPEKKLTVKIEILPGDLTTVKMKSPVRNIRPSIDKIKQLGWTPTVSIEEGFRRSIDSILLDKKSNL